MYVFILHFRSLQETGENWKKEKKIQDVALMKNIITFYEKKV
jgi:hypothetical protein